jgi:signal transduction histidine kinase
LGKVDDKVDLIVKVIDTGIGIKDSDRDKLFKLFGKLSVKAGIN